MRLALRDKAAIPFRVPRGIELIPIEVKSGKRAIYGTDGVILEAFKPGDEPPSNAAVIGSATAGVIGAKPGGVVLVPAQGADAPASGDGQQDGGLTNGSNGLY
jgi:penicillin-binding protein 1A